MTAVTLVYFENERTIETNQPADLRAAILSLIEKASK